MRAVFVLYILFLFGCLNSKTDKDIVAIEVSENRFEKYVFPFSDSGRIFTVRIFDTIAKGYRGRPNAIVAYFHNRATHVDTLFCDSIWARSHPAMADIVIVYREDMDFDGQEDILVSAGWDGRSNLGYHLFLVDTMHQSIGKVKGFDAIGNPERDSSSKLITSCVLSGQSFCEFYAIDRQHRLRQLGKSVKMSFLESDSLNFEKAKRQALEELKLLN